MIYNYHEHDMYYDDMFDYDWRDFDDDIFCEDCFVKEHEADFLLDEEYNPYADYYAELEIEAFLSSMEDYYDREYYLPPLRKERREKDKIFFDETLMWRRITYFWDTEERKKKDCKIRYMRNRRKARKHKHDLCYGGYEDLLDQIYPPYQIEDFIHFEDYTKWVQTELYNKYRTGEATIHQLLGYTGC